MMGNQEMSILFYIIGVIPLLIIFAFEGIPMDIVFLIVVSLVFTSFGIIWINYVVSYNRLQPLINKIQPERDIVWIRVTKNRDLTFQVARKGPYGQTKGVAHRQKADVINKGDFPIRCLNGNPAILVYDMLSHNVNMKEAIGWKKIFKRYKVSSGEEAYYKAVGGKQ